MSSNGLIVQRDVEIALRNDKGDEAKLKAFVVKDFMKKGQNLAGHVTRVIVDYTIGIENFRTSYIVKMNPCRSNLFKIFTEVLFRKEIGFYTKILPVLNEELGKVSERPLKVPRCLLSLSEPSREVMYFEDLQRQDFVMHNSKQCLDKDHVTIMLKELARLHAASVLVLLKPEYRPEHMLENFPFLEFLDNMLDRENSPLKFYQALPDQYASAATVAENSDGYEGVASKIKSKVANATETLFSQVKTTEPQFLLLAHMDCHNNNFLYR